jgi:hypothetical protein
MLMMMRCPEFLMMRRPEFLMMRRPAPPRAAPRRPKNPDRSVPTILLTSLYNLANLSQSAISLHQLFTLCPHLTCERAQFGLLF